MKRKFLLVSCLFIGCIKLSAQGHVIGSFPSMDGGMENQPSSGTAATAVTPYAAAQANYLRNNASVTLTYKGTGGRSGPQYIEVTTGSSGQGFYTPTAALAANTQYVVQYYFKYAGTSNRSFVSSASPNGGSNFGSAASGTNVNSIAVWTKKVDVITSANNTATGFGMIRLNASGGGISTAFFIDDMVVYAGSAADVAVPDDPTAATATNPQATSLDISWTAPGSGVDGGGYVVVRGTADPVTAPNVNGIYAVGNTIGSGTVAYIGTGTSFTDNSLTTGTPYFYRVYTVDKAFNYSAAATATGTPTTVVPLSFISFNAAFKSGVSTLNWSTATEINTDKFEIERSIDGRSFTAIGTVQATGSSAQNNYQFADRNPNNGINYFRIKAIDKDRKFKYSAVVKLSTTKDKQELNITPNPITGNQINLQFTGFSKGEYKVSLLNSNGQVVFTKGVNVEAGSTNQSISLPSSVQKGTYYLQLVNGENKISKQVFIQ